MPSLNGTLTGTEDGVGCSSDVPAQEPSVSCARYPHFLSLLQGWCVSKDYPHDTHTPLTSVARLLCFLARVAHFCSTEGQSVRSMSLGLYRRSAVSRQRKACIHRVCGTSHGAYM